MKPWIWAAVGTGVALAGVYVYNAHFSPKAKTLKFLKRNPDFAARLAPELMKQNVALIMDPAVMAAAKRYREGQKAAA